MTDLLDVAETRLNDLPIERRRVEAGGKTWLLEAAYDQDRLLEGAERLAVFPFGLVLWEAALALADAIADRAAQLNRRRVLELGTGAGLAALAAAAAGAEVVATDHSAEALALARRNALGNGIGGITWRLADWRNWNDPSTYDVVLGADVLYERQQHGPVADVLSRSVGPGGMVLLADPGRLHVGQFIEGLRAQGWRCFYTERRVRALPPRSAVDTVPISLIELERR